MKAKESARKAAHILFVEQGKSAQETAAAVGVSVQSISKWIKRFSWKEERAALQASPRKRIENIKLVIHDITDSRIKLTNELKEAEKAGDTKKVSEIRQQIAQTDYGIGTWNKTLTNIEKETKTTLSTYLYVMESIFNALRSYNEKLYMQTIEFQDEHITNISNQLG